MPDDAAYEGLMRVLEQAVQAGVASIGLEYKGRELMVFHQAGPVGLGAARIVEELQQAVIEELVERAGLGRKSKGKCQSGFIVQFMTYEIVNFDCIDNKCGQAGTRTTGKYTEMWYVSVDGKKNSIHAQFCNDSPRRDAADYWCHPGKGVNNNRRSCGLAMYEGTAFFVASASVKLADYGFGKVKMAGCLLSADGHNEALRDPKVRKSAEVTRRLMTYWDCCAGPDPHKGDVPCCSTVLTYMSLDDPPAGLPGVYNSGECYSTPNAFQCPKSAPRCDCAAGIPPKLK